MAENKKSFILYADLIHTVRKMPIDKAGELFMTILGYVNDENPIVTDTIVDLVFEPIKHQLKRDLKRWEGFRAKQAENGKLGGRPPKKQNPEKGLGFLENPKKATVTQKSLTVTVNDTVNANVNVFIKIGLNQIFQSPSDWLKENKQLSIENLLQSELSGIDRNLIYKRLDSEYMGYSFNDENHVYNTFKLIGKDFKKESVPVKKLTTSLPKPFPKQA